MRPAPFRHLSNNGLERGGEGIGGEGIGGEGVGDEGVAVCVGEVEGGVSTGGGGGAFAACGENTSSTSSPL